jgi:EpsD family peptidyl-prolyl cis-trans isomerase
LAWLHAKNSHCKIRHGKSLLHGGGYVTKAELDYAMEQLGPLDKQATMHLRSRVLDDLINQKLIYSTAEEEGLTGNPAVQLAEDFAEREVVAKACVQTLLAGLNKPADAETVKYYTNPPLRFSKRKVYQLQQMHVQANPDQVNAIRAQLQKSRNLDEL